MANLIKQVSLLLWKNYKLRRQRKARVLVEIIWPLFLFLILVWVRTRGLRSNMPNCYFTEKPLPSSGLLPFLRTYICELNSSCYDYPINNNYDSELIDKLTNNLQNVTNTVINNKNLIDYLLLVFKSITIVNAQRNFASNYTKTISFQQSLIDRYSFVNTVNNDYFNNNGLLLSTLLNASVNYNLLYNKNYSKPYMEPLFQIIPPTNDLSIRLISSLYGNDLDRLNLLDNKVDNITWIRNNLCNLNSTNRKLFGYGHYINIEQYNELIKGLCDFDDYNLTQLITFISSNIDFNSTKLKVYSNTYLSQPEFIMTVLEPISSFPLIQDEYNNIIQLFGEILNDTQTFFKNYSLSRAICGDSKLNIFNIAEQLNITKLLSNFGSFPQKYSYSSGVNNDSINGIHDSISNGSVSSAKNDVNNDNSNATTTTPTTIQTITNIINMINDLSNLDYESCPLKKSNLNENETTPTTTNKKCHCEYIFSIINKLPNNLQVYWKQIKPVLLGKLIYSPNTSQFNYLIKHINSTFEQIDFFITIINTITNDYKLNNATYKEMITQLNNIFGLTNSENLNTIFDNLDFANTIIAFVNNLFKCIEINKFEGFKNEDDAVTRGMNLIDNESFWAAIVFDQSINSSLNSNKNDDEQQGLALPDKVVYKLRMNSSYTHNTFFTQSRFYTYGPDNCLLCNKDFLYGFIYLQDLIERSIIEVKTNMTGANSNNKYSLNMGITTQMQPYPCYVDDKFVRAITRMLPLLMVLAWLYTVSMLVKDIVYEKEKRLKEFMRLMGLTNTTHWLSWFLSALITQLFICLLLCVLLKYGKVTTNSDLSVLFIFFCSFTIATITQCFLISVFFSRANLAAVVAGIIYYLLYLPYTFLVNYSDLLTTFHKFLASLSSTVAFSYGCELIATYELQNVGVTWDNFYESPYIEGGLTMNYICLIMLLDAIIYMLLAAYIETIAPGEYGLSKPFYFPFKLSYWFPKLKKKNLCCCNFGENKNVDEENGLKSSFNLNADIENNLNNNLSDEIGIEINNLHKIYSRGNNHALKGLSLKFYKNEITSFLGHNGAGKSTTMHILTGLYGATSGTAIINGHDINDNLDLVRRSLGFVPQHNVLFDDLSVCDHLWFYARLKGLDNESTLKEMEQLLIDTGLSNKRDAMSKTLSGGMQRKLSVAIAFVGGAKTVILDEPSAGVDPNGRRSIWDLLFKYRNQRTIVISTHHMDEADILGDRIAIIANGKLIAHGTSYYLKQKYGRGYYLKVSKKNINVVDEKDLKIVSPRQNANEFLRENSIKDENDLLKTEQDKRINDFIKSRMIEACLIENIGYEMTYSISNKAESTKTYEKLFHEFENNLEELGIDSIGISDTTLEEIFVKLAKQPEPIEKSHRNKISKFFSSLFSKNKEKINTEANGIELNHNFKTSAQENLDEDTMKKYSAYTKKRVKSKSVLLKQQLKSLMIKKFHRVKRNIKGFIAEIVLPVIFVCMALLVATLVPGIEQRPPLELHPWYYGSSLNLFYSEGKTNSNSIGSTSINNSRNLIKEITNTFYDKPSVGTRCMNNHKIVVTNYLDYSRTNKKTYELDCLDNGYTVNNNTQLPTDLYQSLLSTNYTYTKVSPPCQCSEGFPSCEIGSGGDIEYKYVSRLVTTDTLYDLTDRNVTDWLINTEFNKKYFRKRFGGFEFLEPIVNYKSYSEIFQLVNNILNTTTNLTNLFNPKAAIFNDRIKIWYNNKGYISDVAHLNIINNAMLRAYIKLNGIEGSRNNETINLNKYGIVAINHPMNYTTEDLERQLTIQLFIDLFVAICIIFALSFIPASFLVFLLEERESNSKQLQFVSGVKPYIYWISNYIWDFINYIVPCVLCIIIFFIFDVQTYISKENFPCLIVLMILYGWAVIPLMYPLNYIFKIPSTAFVLSSSLNVFIGVVSTMTTTILEQLSEEEPDLREINDIIKPIFVCLFPHYCLGKGFLDMSILYNTAKVKRSLGLKATYSPFDFDQVGQNLIALAVQGIMYFALNMLIEYKFFVRFKPSKSLKSFQEPLNEDDDVKEERIRIKNYQNNKRSSTSNDFVRMTNLSKSYNKLEKCHIKRHLAVKSLCLGINKGECFGLIGVNGAGKTTTFKMLTGEIPITAGDAFINGYSVSKELENVHRNIGYCPQTDAIFPLLTAREHLLFYARLRGIPEKHVNEVSIWAANRVGLNVYMDRIAGDFSGGNKRKLSTAIAIIGDPSVIFLDEPTSGMDAKARRLLWNDIISLIKENRLIVLTSHSMEECEALCTRLVIMVDGEFKCLGTPQHLKSKFGDGYKISFRTKEETLFKRLLELMKMFFPESKFIEKHKNTVEFSVPFKNIKISKLFGNIEKIKTIIDIDDYSVTQTTLDQIFVNFAKTKDELVDGSNEFETLNTVNIKSNNNDPEYANEIVRL